MACEQNQNKAKLGAVANAVSRWSSKAGNVAGTLATGVNRALDRTDRVINTAGKIAAPVTAMAINVIGPRDEQSKRAARGVVGLAAGTTALAVASNSQARAQAGKALAAGGRLAGNAAVGLLPHAGSVRLAIKAADKVTSTVGTGLGALSKTGQAGTVMREKRTLFFFKSKTPVSLWTSNLTEFINKRDVMIVQGKNIVSSRGLMFKTGGRTWHQGTTVVKLGGQKRTITHLQSLNMPACHYYFDRPLSPENAVGIATGKVAPERVPGFAGQVSATESLAPSWAATKQALIKAHLHWPAGKRL